MLCLRLPKVIAKDKNWENAAKLVVDVILMHCNVVNKHQNFYEQFGQLITIAPHSLTM